MNNALAQITQSTSLIITDADGSRGVAFSVAFVCLSVCLSLSVFFPHDISKTAAAIGSPNLASPPAPRNVPPRVLDTHLFWN